MSTNRAIFDSSAVLALLRGEPGAKVVEAALDGSALSTVNLSEVVQKAEQRNLFTDGLEFDLEGMGVEVIAFDTSQARLASDIWVAWPRLGLSLGDRACLALTRVLGGEAVTADRRWAGVAGSIPVRLLR